MKTWFTSDQHYSHDNKHGGIITLTKRPFDSIPEMDEALIVNHNAVVSPEDTIWHLGDFAYKCSAERASSILHRLNGRHCMLWGNHDRPLRQALKSGMLNDLLHSGRLEFIGSPDHKTSTSLEVTIARQRFWLSHYAHRTWPGAFRNVIHCFGHSHGNLSDLYRSTDVGVDNNGFFPVSVDSIIEKFQEVREFKEDC